MSHDAGHIHAILAVAAAITRLVDSHNGWKDLGQ